MCTEIGISTIQQMAEHLVQYAARLGVVLTIEQESIEPFKMGNYHTVVSTRAVIARDDK